MLISLLFPTPVPVLNLSPALLLLISGPMLSKQLAVAVTIVTAIRAPVAPKPAPCCLWQI